uniref:Uncharacterized protein n=1 Tax=Melopsittacus undulatus TaxID=13146 RepID=A0A8V5GEC5_MELUD
CIKLLQSSGADFNKKDKCGSTAAVKIFSYPWWCILEYEVTNCHLCCRTPLHYAAANCHFHCIETLVTTGANINETDDWGRTPLHYAAASDIDRKKNILGNSHENAEELERATEMKEKEAALCLEFLLQNDANPSIQDKEGYNTVHYAAAYGHRQCLELLLEKTNMFEESDSAATKSPLHLAAYNGHHQALEVLLQSLVDLDIKDEKGRTALDLAAFRGHAECVEALISQGASVIVKDNVTKRTPLHASVINGHTPCLRLLLEVADNPNPTDACSGVWHIDAVSLLLEKEASVDAADLLGCTALHRGIMTGHEECVQMLLEKEVSILCKDARGRTPLHFAAALGHATWLSELLQIALSEEDCSLKDNQGYTPLHWACYNGHENCIEVLLEQKFFRTFYGNSFSPLHCAVINDHENCASLLIGAIDASIVNCEDDKGRTPLHAAAFANHVECLQLLLSHSAQVNAADHAGKTPLMMAAQNGHTSAVDFLVNIAKADLTLKDKESNTPLHLASSKIQEQSLINAKNNALQTPLHIAARNGLKMVVEKLLAKGACVLAVDENGK